MDAFRAADGRRARTCCRATAPRSPSSRSRPGKLHERHSRAHPVREVTFAPADAAGAAGQRPRISVTEPGRSGTAPGAEHVLATASGSTRCAAAGRTADVLGVVAGHPVPGVGALDHPQLRALVVRSGSAAATGSGCGSGSRSAGSAGDGQVAGEQDPLPAVLDLRVRHRHRRQQRPGVRVQRVVVERLRRRLLDQRAEVHHADPVADVPDHGQVVRDHQVGQARARPAAPPAG